jgi:WD40 repeat protein
MVTAYDIRDGDVVMKWEVSNPVIGMEYSSPLQWRSRGKVVIAGSESIGLWDVNSLDPQPLLSVASGKKVYCLHVNNTDAEVGGGVRQR